MRFGLFYEHQLPRPWHDGDEERLLNNALEQVELADRVGFDHVWEVEHHFLEEYSHSSAPEVFLAAASQRTNRIRLGHGIVQLPPPVNHPARIVERAATLDLLSGGRVDLGTGEGSSQVELGGFGVPRDVKREQWEEALDVTVRMMTEDPFVGHRGTWIDIPPRNVVPKPKQRPHPPLWVACSRRETIEMAARKGIGALSFSFVEPEDAKPWVDAYYDLLASDECVAAGEAVNANLAVVVPFMCHEDEATAIERGIDGAHFFGYSLAHYYVFGEHRPGATNLWDEFDRYRHERGFARDLVRAEEEPLGMKVLERGVGSLRGAVGTPEQITDLVRRYEAAGVDQVIFVAQSGRNRHEHVCEAIELFADQVLPRFVDGREEHDLAKRERLAGVAEAAVERGRRRRARVAAAADAMEPAQVRRTYVVGPQGELRPAAETRPARSGALGVDRRAVRRRVEEKVRGALTAVTRRLGDDRLRALAERSATLRIVFEGMVRLVDPRAAAGLTAAYGFRIGEGAETQPWTIRVADGEARVEEGVGADVDVTFVASRPDFLRIVSGELPMGRAIMDERLIVEGDVALAARFGSLFGESMY